MKFSQLAKKATLATVLGASMMMPFSDYIYAQNSSFPETGIVESVTRGETKNEAQKVTNYLEKTNEEIGLLEGKIITLDPGNGFGGWSEVYDVQAETINGVNINWYMTHLVKKKLEAVGAKVELK